ncbi:hypothetical protein [Desulfospira joergensenii]|uniref:hypothetical protein n=1 Tax=Desulfospira joergensenii TaxID=53329 RepID=UPI0003B3BDEF|nr:hypothetical protein [Desulfospira joergensenii]
MKKCHKSALLILAALFLLFSFAAIHAHAYTIEIDVAPNVLNIQSQSTIVTVHTDIAYGVVDGATVTLNGIPINYWKSDDRGNFVAKFLSDEVKTLDGLIIWETNELVLYGYDNNGEAFLGKQEIMVINNIPAGKD